MQLLTKIFKICPKSGRIVKIRLTAWWAVIVFPVIGLAALIWVLVRVLPKPSRAAYPCQKIALPVAGSFIAWLAGFSGISFLFVRVRSFFADRRYILGIISLAAFIGIAAWSFRDELRAATWNFGTVQIPLIAGPNAPVGTGRGVFPGRVAWAYDSNATSFVPGVGTYHSDAYNNQAVIDTMVADAVRKLAGRTDTAAAWNALCEHFNVRNGRTGGYVSGQKIVIKINQNNNTVGGSSTNLIVIRSDTKDINTSPQVVLALLRTLAAAGVPQNCITVTDPSRAIKDCIYVKCTNAGFTQVRFVDLVGGSGRIKAAFVTNGITYSVSAGETLPRNPSSDFVNADYVINLGLMKLHSAGHGQTLCAKNWFGATGIGAYNDNIASPQVHAHMSWKARDVSGYIKFVDWMGHKDLGGKTVLFLLDALYPHTYVTGEPWEKWQMAPFNNDWASSVFASQDGVAIDSVGTDFLLGEWNKYFTQKIPTRLNDANPQVPNTGLENCDYYLNEAALADARAYYKLNGIGGTVPSLGVFEHWDSSISKQYSRNKSATNTGIELVRVYQNPPAVSIAAPSNGAVMTAPGACVITANAVDSDGTILKVSFFTNGVKVGEDITGTDGWTANLTGLSAGTYSITAQTFDNDGASALSAAITVTVNAATSPSGIPLNGLALWLEADALALTLGSGDAVAVWKATAGPDALRCTVALPNGKAPTAPTFSADAMNGKPAVRFDGADNQMTIPGGIATRLAGKPFSIFMVSRSASATFGITGNSANGSGGVPRLYIERQGTVYNESSNLAQVPTQASAVELVSSLHDGTNMLTGYLNGVKSKDITAPVSAIGGTGDMAIPFWPGSAQSGDLSAVLIYDRRLSDAERTGVERYLIQKYSIGTAATNVTPSAGSNVILIGDSIRMGYQPYVSNLLTNLIPVSGPAENCQHSGIVTQYLKTWVIDKKPALVHMNAGLHDLIENKSTGIFQIPTNQYAANLDYIFRTLRDNNIRVIWSTTTPVIDAVYSNWNLGQTFIRHDADAVMYNNVARAVLARYNIPVFDMYAYVKTLDPGAVYYQDGLHYTAAGYRLLAAQVSAFISNNLSNTAAPIIVPPAFSVSHGSLTTNGAFAVTLSVNKNFGYWSTNASTGSAQAVWNQFTSAGATLPIASTTTLRVYGASNGVSSATNSYVYTVVPATPACDLVITGISWTPLNPKPGTNVTMRAIVSNAGSGASSNAFLAVVFRVDGTNLSYGGSTMSLAAGAAITVTGAYAWSVSPTNVWKAAAGTHTVFALVDDINRIPEANESNNSNSAVLAVSSGPAEIYLEAESGTLTAPMAKYADDTNAAGSYIMAPPVNNSLAAAPSNGMAIYTFTVPETGVYRVSGRIKAVNGNHDSFWVKMNSGAWVQWNNIGYTNSIAMKSNWNWVEVFNTAAAGSVMEYTLTAGVQYTLSIAYREDTTKLDRILIRKIEPASAPVSAAALMMTEAPPQMDESSSQFYPQPELRPVPSITASASVDAVKNMVGMKYTVNMNGVELYEIWYAVSEAGMDAWQALSPDAVTGGVFSLTSLNGDNAWQVRGLMPGKNYDLRVTAVADQGAGMPYIIRNIETGRLFSEQLRADTAAVLNNPYRGGSEGMTFVNLPAGSTVKIYTVAGSMVASLGSGNDGSGRIVWNVLRDDGQKVKPGIYLCRISSPAGNKLVKVIVQR